MLESRREPIRERATPKALFAWAKRCSANSVGMPDGFRPAEGRLLPFGTVFSSSINAASLGSAFGMLDVYRDAVEERVKLAYGNATRHDPFSQILVAQFSSIIDAAWLQLERNSTAVGDKVNRGEAP